MLRSPSARPNPVNTMNFTPSRWNVADRGLRFSIFEFMKMGV